MGLTVSRDLGLTLSLLSRATLRERKASSPKFGLMLMMMMMSMMHEDVCGLHGLCSERKFWIDLLADVLSYQACFEPSKFITDVMRRIVADMTCMFTFHFHT